MQNTSVITAVLAISRAKADKTIDLPCASAEASWFAQAGETAHECRDQGIILLQHGTRQ